MPEQQQQQQPSPYVRGFKLAVEGMKIAFRSPEVRKAYLRVAVAVFLLTLVISSGSIWALWTGVAPGADTSMWLVVVMWVVRIVGSLVALLIGPLLAIFTINIAFPMFNRAVFMAGLRAVDPERAAALEAKPGMAFGPSTANAIWRLIKFLLLSLCCLAISLIPVVGTILGTLAEAWLTARTIAWELLDPYFDCLDIHYSEQRQFVAHHHKALIGFGVPISLMLAVPIAGPLLFGLAQAAGAIFVAREVPVDPRERQQQPAPAP